MALLLTCHGAQQLLAQLPLDASAPGGAPVLASQGANDPGPCDERDPGSGGDAALVVDGPLTPGEVPASGVSTLPAVSGFSLVDASGDHDDARRGCGVPMGLVARLEEGHDPDTRANADGGCACRGCATGRCPWQY